MKLKICIFPDSYNWSGFFVKEQLTCGQEASERLLILFDFVVNKITNDHASLFNRQESKISDIHFSRLLWQKKEIEANDLGARQGIKCAFSRTHHILYFAQKMRVVQFLVTFI